MPQPLNRWLRIAPPMVLTSVAGFAGFVTYFSMYAFRKPFTAATFSGIAGWHYALDFKIALVIAQLIGYATAKFIGIRVIAAMQAGHRARTLLGLMAASWLALIGLAVAPPLAKVAAMFLNGLSLGMIWGLVFGYMEGRRTTEILTSVMCASFILSSGVVKSVGVLLMGHLHVPVLWMPAVTGLVFTPVLLLGVWLLTCLPPPNAADEVARVRRAPMTMRQVRTFLGEYAFGVTVLIVLYVFITAIRDFRDNFAAELWLRLGYSNPAALFSATEVPVALIALIALGVMSKVQSNARALALVHGMLAAGLLMMGLATLAFDSGMLSAIGWMIVSGAGLYVVYTPFNAVIFDRLVAVSGRVGTAGFLIYVADSAGYAGSVALLLWRNFGLHSIEWLSVFRYAMYATAVLGLALVGLSLLYYNARTRAPALLQLERV